MTTITTETSCSPSDCTHPHTYDAGYVDPHGDRFHIVEKSPAKVNRRQFVHTQFVREGYHYFPEAASDPRYATGDHMDVSHLGSRHMHYFYFKVWVEVTHANRDIEFIQLRRWLESLYTSGQLELDHKSCEMISDDLYAVVFDKYPVEIRIDVSEDNINGSYTEYQIGA